ncbi:5-(carboxyamino)imidazole ribonucleotide synthase [Candidatus Nitrospira allomarina]|uniref:N5-carboxyaminoimidazole ribonucleotide synthase n=1 Tax=Candidatus Nitrospira allomarina TaxID=3020900 RepID=A0AA96GKL0_9BACT|nr:5-(carboxyamino)imidazole ribonucleotide synthase [Candidatus Nitrospira allomarina]WNM60049.1 5-(carboxyamino)imidazole ribonucleotide synthase [Candidatus Nitrospira allomarina]
MKIILPGGTIGILGGGQLGRMLAMEGRRMGYRTGVLDPVENCPAAQVADFFVQSELSNTQRVMDFVSQVDVVTIETELVPWMLLADIETGQATRPSSSVLALIQDRLVQREFLQDHGFPQTPFASIKDHATLTAAAQHVAFPAILKKRRAGYDGKGQIRVAGVNHLNEAWRELKEVPSVLEAVAHFKMELSVVLARSPQGDIQLYPLAENAHRQNILHTTRVPARVTDTIRLRAEELAVSLSEALDYCGVMAVEFFLLEDDTLLINEIAPRPHNSGHFTFGACVTSQFEQHLRAICGLPLGDTSLMHPVVMVNLLGDLWRNGPPKWDRLLAHPQVRLHLYGKTHAAPGRKMGHFLLIVDNPDQSYQQAEYLLQSMMDADSQEKSFPISKPAKEPFQKPSRPLETPA